MKIKTLPSRGAFLSSFKQRFLIRQNTLPDRAELPLILACQGIGNGHSAEYVLHRGIQRRTLAVIGGEDKIHTVLGQQILHTGAVALLIYSDSLSAVGDQEGTL